MIKSSLMIERLSIAALTDPAYIGQVVPIAGFVDSIRRQGQGLTFVDIRDNTGEVQTVYKPRSYEDLAISELGTAISVLTPESVVALRGLVIDNQRVTSRDPRRVPGIELGITGLDILSRADNELPIAANSSLETRLEHPYLDMRRPERALLFATQTAFEAAATRFALNQGWNIMHSSKLVSTPTEGGAEVFTVAYFGRDAYLTQSPQFAKQRAIASGFPGVFEIGAAYRAENSNTSRHITEFTSVDAEIPYVSDHHDIMDIEEDLLRFAISEVITKHGVDIESTYGRPLTIPKGPIPRISLAEARALVAADGYNIPEGTRDLDPEGERRICRIIEKKFNSQFVFITDFPANIRPFYHMRHPDNTGLTRSFDLLWRGVEITTGAQREHRLNILTNQILEKGLSIESFADYLNNFRYGCPPHGGFGLGLNRLLALMTNTQNVSEATYQPNTPTRLTI